MYDPFAVAVHEAGHAAVAFLRGIPVVHVGLTPGVPDQNGICQTTERTNLTLSQLVDQGVMVAAGGVAERLAGNGHPGDGIDLTNLETVRVLAAHQAPPGWRFPDVHAMAWDHLRDALTWAGVVTLARALVAFGRPIPGSMASATMRAGWRRDTELVRRIQLFGHRAVR